MKDGYIDKFDLERVISAVEDDLGIDEKEKGQYVVWNKDNDGSDKHLVNLKKLHCSCPDYEYNCQSKESELGDTKICKHIVYAMLKVHGVL